MKISTNVWVKEWPKEKGRYWFYGWPYGRTHEMGGKPIAPELSMVIVWKVSNGLAFIREGNFWGASEGAIGLFCKANIPTFPDAEVMKMIPTKLKTNQSV